MQLTVRTEPAVIEANFDALEKQLAKELENYNFVVTMDTVKDSKSRATELNKLKGEIDTKRKEVVGAASEPIKLFDARAKKLTGMCEEVRQGILEQVKRFEQNTLDLARHLLSDYLEALYEKNGIREEFQTAEIGDLVKLTAVTKNEMLTKASREAVESRASQCMTAQQRVDLRLSQLENECYRAGLHSPLSREHVEGFLFADDDRYQHALEAVIKRELDRQAETERRAQEAAKRQQEEEARKTQQEAERNAKQEAETAQKPEAASEAAAPAQSEAEPAAAEPAPITKPAAPGQVSVTVNCTFVVEVPATVTDDAVVSSLRKKLEQAGIKDSIHSITAHRQREAA